MGRGTARTAQNAAIKGSTVVTASAPVDEKLVSAVRDLVRDLGRMGLDELAPPDYEARAHEREHLAGASAGAGADGEKQADGKEDDKETPEQQAKREAILPDLRARLGTLSERAMQG